MDFMPEEAIEPDRPDTPASTDPQRWVEAHGDVMYRFALRRLRSADLAEEVVQETFVAALGARERFDHRASERTWLIGILRRKIVDQFRRRARERPAGDEAAAAAMADLFDDRGLWRVRPGAWSTSEMGPIEAQHLRRALDECIKGLPPGTADAIILREVEGMETSAICKVLQITPTNLWTRLHRARALLRRCLEQNWLDRAGGERER